MAQRASTRTVAASRPPVAAPSTAPESDALALWRLADTARERGIKVRRADADGMVKVSSASSPGQYYEVGLWAGPWGPHGCECEGYARAERCTHLAAGLAARGMLPDCPEFSDRVSYPADHRLAEREQRAVRREPAVARREPKMRYAAPARPAPLDEDDGPSYLGDGIWRGMEIVDAATGEVCVIVGTGMVECTGRFDDWRVSS